MVMYSTIMPFRLNQQYLLLCVNHQVIEDFTSLLFHGIDSIV